MNERYQELVRLAVEDAAKYSKRRFDSTVEENETFALSFAELIVRECVQKCQTDWYGDSLDDICKQMKQHFGVE